MTKTTNYNLNQWDAADPIRRKDFNSDNAAIDAALNAIKSAAEEDVRSLGETVTALAANVGTAGQNARIVCGSYTGTGTYGASNPCSLTFDFYPCLVIVGSGSSYSGTNTSILLRGRAAACSDDSSGTQTYIMTVSWSDNGVSWYSKQHATGQNNDPGVYYYVAIGYENTVEQ